MSQFYSDERNTRMLIALLKAHGIKRVVASPGSTNVNFVGSIQNDDFFEVYSCVDERSAAYMACGLAAETNEPVVITCTEATASRNYLPGLTEAFYRKLPVLAVTAARHPGKIGNNIAQVIDRSSVPNDVVKLSVSIPAVMPTQEDVWSSNLLINKALLELKRNGGGPVHINLHTNFTPSSYNKEPEEERVIKRICCGNSLPKIPNGKIGIYVGAHKKWTPETERLVDDFCAFYDAVVLCDNTSNFWGEYRIQAQLATYQSGAKYDYAKFDLLIHIGDVSGAGIKVSAKEVWRVNPDGEIRDTFRKLSYVFEMEEGDFFSAYVGDEKCASKKTNYLELWKSEYERIYNKIPELPFSNIWVAQQTMGRLPKESVVHFGIWNSLMSWNYFIPPYRTLGYSNTGGFGIDGGVSTLLGASLVHPEKPYFGIVGDLAFFYDMNAIGNRHVGKNIRLMLINNGCGVQFHLSGTYPQRVGIPDLEVHKYIAAGGHYGDKAPQLVQNYVQALGFKYLCAHNKEEYMENLSEFICEEVGDRPILFEVFIDYNDDPKAEDMIRSTDAVISRGTRKFVKDLLGEKNVQKLKGLIKK